MNYVIKVKCRECSLHFQVFSDNENWHVEYHGKMFCPECGSQGPKIIWEPDETDLMIFEFVPGMTEGLYAIT